MMRTGMTVSPVSTAGVSARTIAHVATRRHLHDRLTSHCEAHTIPDLTPSPSTGARAQKRIASSILRTPLVRYVGTTGAAAIHLKLENLQPIGSFKTPRREQRDRCSPRAGALARTACGPRAPATWRRAWRGRRAVSGIAVHGRGAGSRARNEARRRCAGSGEDHRRSRSTTGSRYSTHPSRGHGRVVRSPGQRSRRDGRQRDHRARDPGRPRRTSTPVIAPYGGGGLSVRHRRRAPRARPQARMFVSEVDTSAAFAAAREAGHPARIEYRASFVDGMGSPFVLPRDVAAREGTARGLDRRRRSPMSPPR